MGKPLRRIAVIGGGITGLSAAYYLRKLAEANGQPVHIVIYEAEADIGGKIQTDRRSGFVIERGPDSFLSRKLPIMELSRELGIEPDFTELNPEAKRTYILRCSKLHTIPPGLSLGIPTKLVPFMTTGLLSPAGKARAALDLVLPRRADSGDETLGAFIRRRLGDEVADNLVEPLLAGIYAGSLDELSLRSTFPQYHLLEEKHRSIIAGMLSQMKQGGAAKGPGTQPLAPPQRSFQLPEIARRSVFLSYRSGLSTLVEALRAKLEEGRVEFQTGSRVSSLDRLSGGRAWLVGTSGGEVPDMYDAVIVTLPSYAAAELAAPHADEAALIMRNIPYVSVANVALAYDARSFGKPLDGSGFVIPRSEGTNMTACTWTSMKWTHTAPKGKVLLRCYFGRSGDEGWTERSDEQITLAALSDIKSTMGVAADPEFVRIHRWPRSMPQYRLGHLDSVRRMRDVLAEKMPGVFAAGSAYEGVGIPDCIAQGRQAADHALGFIGSI